VGFAWPNLPHHVWDVFAEREQQRDERPPQRMWRQALRERRQIAFSSLLIRALDRLREDAVADVRRVLAAAALRRKDVIVKPAEAGFHLVR
jgi:hypothetical protein